MIVTESIQVNGRKLVKTYSDRNVMIERDGVRYDAAIDPAGSGRTYTETDEPVPEEPMGQPGQEDVLELLETITVDDEEMTQIVWNGTYQLKAAVCTVYLPLTNGDSGNMTMYVSSGSRPIGYASIPGTSASTSAKRVKFRFYRKAGEYFTEGVVFPNAEEEFGGVTMYLREYATPKIVESLGPIAYINIQKSNVARLPLGTEIKLYGVRA